MRVVAVVLSLMLCACGGEAGPQGIQGPPGPAGAPGPAGPSGIGIVEARTCLSGPVSVSSTFSILLGYTHYRYADGGVMAVCEVINGTASYSSVSAYGASMQGADEGTCLVVYDVDAITTGFWDFTLSGDTMTAKYYDPSSANHGKTVVLACPPL